MRYILILLILLNYFSLIAQQKSDYKTGHIVLLNSDTLNGKVMDRNESAFGGLLNKIRFKPEKGWKKKYKPSQLNGYLRGEERFISIWISTESQFLKQRYYSIPGVGEQSFVKVLYSGSLELYHWEYMDGDNDMIDHVPLIKKPDSNEMVRVTQGVLGLKRKRLAGYFSDCPELAAGILDRSVRTVDRLIEEYEANCLNQE